jgi:hypothetical protein
MTIPPATPSALPHGIYCPTVSFFRPTAEQELDTETFAQHVEFLAKSGLQGIVIGGSNGEAVALDREEMVEVSGAPATPRLSTDRIADTAVNPPRRTGLQAVRATRNDRRRHGSCANNAGSDTANARSG